MKEVSVQLAVVWSLYAVQSAGVRAPLAHVRIAGDADHLDEGMVGDPYEYERVEAEAENTIGKHRGIRPCEKTSNTLTYFEANNARLPHKQHSDHLRGLKIGPCSCRPGSIRARPQLYLAYLCTSS